MYILPQPMCVMYLIFVLNIDALIEYATNWYNAQANGCSCR